MKRTMISVLGAVLMLTSTMVFGLNDSNLKVEIIGEREVRVQVQNIAGTASVILQDEEGEILFKEMISTSTYEKRFDLTFLKRGSYILKIADDFKIQTTRINLADVLLTEFQELYFQPVVTQKDGVITVSKLATENEKLTVRIYDVEGVLLYNDTLQGKDFIGRGYDFSRVPKGTYSIFLASNGHSVNRRIDIR